MENNVLRTSNTYREALKQGLHEVLQNNEPVFLGRRLWKNYHAKNLGGLYFV